MGPMPIFTEVPTDIDLAALEQSLTSTGVAILNPELKGKTDELANVVAQVRGDGIENFTVVVLAHDYNPDTSLRDLGNQVHKDIGADSTMTVLVMSPNQVAGYSNQLSRFQIEKGQDGSGPGRLELSNPPAAAADFADTALDATFPWTGFTVGLILLTAALAGVARIRIRARSRAVDSARRSALASVGRPGDGSGTAAGGDSEITSL